MVDQEEQRSETGAAPPVAAEESPFNWYVVQTYSSFENRVRDTIEHKITIENLKDRINRVLIPTESVVEIKGGKKRTVQRALMPGYVLIEMVPDEDLFNLIKEVKGVSSFVGDGHSPAPLSREEIANLIDIMEDKQEKPKARMTYRKGDQIKVIEGPFTGFVGQVDEVDAEKGKLKVMCSIFGRPTAVELDVLQIEQS